MTMLRAQTSRIWSYFFTRAGALLLVASMGVLLGQYWLEHRPPPKATVAAMEQRYEAAAKDWQVNGQQLTRECLDAEAAARGRGEPTVAFNCDRLEPTREAYVDLNGAHYSDVLRLVLLFVTMASMAAFIVAATSVNNDLGSNVLSTELTFEPRRDVVFLSRLGAAALTSLCFGLAATTLGAGLALLSVRLLAATPSDARGDLGRLASFSLRSTLVVVAVGAIGFALTWMTRHALTSLLIVGVWFALVEAPVAQMSALVPLRSWTFSSNFEAMAYGRGSYELQVCDLVEGCVTQAVTFSAIHAFLIYVGVPVLLALVAGATFRRRDIV